MTTPVNFPIAKLLKEKGFDKRSEPYRYNNIGELTFLEGLNAPTIAEVIMWFYEKHGIWLSVNIESESGVFFYAVDKNKGEFFYDKGEDFTSPTEAYEAGIKYTLENLI